MPSDARSNISTPEVSERETQFVPQDDDDETLWEAIEITAEKGIYYKVRWAGVDPKTGKEWAQTWTPKEDCTDDLAMTWKLKKAKKKASRRKRTTQTASKRSAKSRASVASTVTPSTMMRRSATATATATPHPPNGKRRRTSETPQATSDEGVPPTPRPKKRRKAQKEEEEETEEEQRVVESSQESYEVKPPSELRKVLPKDVKHEEEESEVEERRSLRSGARPGPSKGKGRARPEEDSEEPEEEVGATISRPPSRKRPTLSNTGRTKKVFERVSEPKHINRTSPRKSTATKRAAPPLSSGPAKKKSSNGKGKIKKPAPPPVPPSESEEEDDDAHPPPKHPSPSASRSHRSNSSAIEAVEDDDSDLPELPYVPPPVAASSPPAQPQDRPPSPILSPAALERARIFDEEIVELERLEAAKAALAPQPSSSKKVSRPPSLLGSPITAPVPVQASPPRDLVRQIEENLPDQSPDKKGQSKPVERIPPAEPGPTQPARAANAPAHVDDDSFRQEIVPETETEPSQSQSQEKQLQQQMQLQLQTQSSPPPPKSQIFNLGRTAPVDFWGRPQSTQLQTGPTKSTTPLRASGSSLIKSMRPRTPGSLTRVSSEDIDFSGDKLPAVWEADEIDLQKKDGDTGDSRTSVESGGERERDLDVRASTGSGSGKKGGREKLRPIPQMSPSQFAPHMSTPGEPPAPYGTATSGETIEQFSSPEKKGDMRKKLSAKLKGKGKARASDEESLEDVSLASSQDEGDESLNVMKRGMEIAEEMRRKTKEKPEARRIQLIDLARAAKKEKGKETRLKVLERGVRRGASEARGNPALDESRTQNDTSTSSMEQVEADSTCILALRQEEEESTQDLSAEQQVPLGGNIGEMEVDIVMGEPPEIGEQQEEREVMVTIAEERGVADEVSIDHEIEEQELMYPPQPEELEHVAAEAPSRPSSAASSASRRPPPRELELELVLPSTLPKASSQLEIPESSQEVIPQNEPQHLSAAIVLLNAKSDEISTLENSHSAERAKRAALEKEIEALQRAAAATSQLVADLQSELVEARQKKVEWEQEKASLVASTNSLTQQKQRTEQDLDFFREQYARASGFVSEIRKENQQLEQRAQIAEQQAKTGVEVVKKTYQKRVEQLEDDCRSWKRLATFIMEKDQRTNDDIRRRAAEEPQLRVRVEVLEEENARLMEKEEEVARLTQHSNMLEDDLEVQHKHVKDLEHENEVWRKQTATLNVEVNVMRVKLKALEKEREREGRGEDQEDPDEIVFQCQWRPENGGNQPCGRAFRSISELQAHLYQGAHLGEHLYQY